MSHYDAEFVKFAAVLEAVGLTMDALLSDGVEDKSHLDVAEVKEIVETLAPALEKLRDRLTSRAASGVRVEARCIYFALENLKAPALEDAQ